MPTGGAFMNILWVEAVGPVNSQEDMLVRWQTHVEMVFLLGTTFWPPACQTRVFIIITVSCTLLISSLLFGCCSVYNYLNILRSLGNLVESLLEESTLCTTDVSYTYFTDACDQLSLINCQPTLNLLISFSPSDCAVNLVSTVICTIN